ncbi:EamA family transporter [uncultured Paracoccus sp.]|uniref:EamA family transporter n=1 Tax=uncultured Paracoccus sp. TaxID=189685 RepID=UPI002638A13D|nr:EamA family transporter [uncultured Paracoccus sp.]
MNRRDTLLAMLVPVLWGLNFPATAYALQHYPPLLTAALRFILLSIPTILLVPRPQVRLIWLVGTGLGLGLMQFAFLYTGMAVGMPPGLASLVLQAQAPFTMLLAVLLLGERLSARAGMGVAIAVAGLMIVGAARAQTASWLPVVLTLLAALGWAIGNLCSRLARPSRPLHLTMWMSVIPPLPLLALSLLLEGPQVGPALAGAFTRAALPANLGLLYIVVCSSVIGFGIWNTLMTRHPASVVAPWSLLVPVVGVLSSWAAFGDMPSATELAAGGLVIVGVLIASRSWRRIVVPAPV